MGFIIGDLFFLSPSLPPRSVPPVLARIERLSAEIFSLLNWSKNPPNRAGYPPPLLIELRRLLYLRFRAAPFRGGTRNPGLPGARAIKRYFSQTIAFPLLLAAPSGGGRTKNVSISPLQSVARRRSPSPPSPSPSPS